jgi:sporulation protein YhbH
MALKIEQDHSRFRQIVRGKIRENLKKYISKGEMIGRKGRDTISIPVPQIDLPKFTFDHRDTGGVGQGEGDPGTVLQPGNVQPGSGPGEAGSEGGEHALEVDVTFDELAQMLGEALELPNIEPKGKERIVSSKNKYTGIRSTGPESLRHFRRTFKSALKRQIIMQQYDPKNPIIVPTRDDRRYRSWQVKSEPETSAVVIYMMDVSGSMGDEQKEIVRIESFWIDTWLRSQYEGLDVRYIIHDAMAKEVDRDTFFHTRESGGTMISSAYKLAADIIEADYPVSEYNIYPFHFSDGDNWSADDTRLCLDIVRNRLMPAANVFCYGQVESPYGSGQFIKDIREAFGGDEKVLTSEIPHKDAIYKSIKDFLGKGK